LNILSLTRTLSRFLKMANDNGYFPALDLGAYEAAHEDYALQEALNAIAEMEAKYAEANVAHDDPVIGPPNADLPVLAVFADLAIGPGEEVVNLPKPLTEEDEIALALASVDAAYG
jgi:hypothetical protein